MIDKYIELNHLPRNKRNNIDWGNSKGYKCKFKYDNIEGEVEIIDYINKGSRVIFKYKDEIYNTQSGRFRDVQFRNILKIVTTDFRFEIDDVIKDERRNLTITSKYHDTFKNGKKYKSYNYKCNICGYEGHMSEYDLLGGHTCSVCSGKVVMKGYNDISTTHPHLVKYLKNKEDAFKYSAYSMKTITFKCPDCGYERNRIINQVTKNDSMGCLCKDGKSYPEKFIFNILQQCNIEFETQYSPKWAKGKRYDFYIPKLNMIIETHGEQHYKDRTQFRTTLKHQQENDRNKKMSAIENGVKEYIQLDCSVSSVEYIMNSLHKSTFIKYFNLENINLSQANEFANKNIIKYVCEEYNKYNKIIPMKEIAKKLNLHYPTFQRYLKMGNDLGFCIYKNKTKKPIKIVETNEVFESAVDCVKFYKEKHNIEFDKKMISYILKHNPKKDINGYHFEYAKEDGYGS